MIFSFKILGFGEYHCVWSGPTSLVATPNATTYRFLSGIPSSFCPVDDAWVSLPCFLKDFLV